MFSANALVAQGHSVQSRTEAHVLCRVIFRLWIEGVKLSHRLLLLQKTRLGWDLCEGGLHVKRRLLVATAYKDNAKSSSLLDER